MDIAKADFYALIRWDVYTRYTCHVVLVVFRPSSSGCPPTQECTRRPESCTLQTAADHELGAQYNHGSQISLAPFFTISIKFPALPRVYRRAASRMSLIRCFTSSIGMFSVDGMQIALGPIVIDQGFRLLMVYDQAFANRIGVVIRTPLESGASAAVANAFGLGKAEEIVKNLAAAAQVKRPEMRFTRTPSMTSTTITASIFLPMRTSSSSNASACSTVRGKPSRINPPISCGRSRKGLGNHAR